MLWTSARGMPGHKSPNIVFLLTPGCLCPTHRAAIEGLRGLAGVPGHVSHGPGSFSSGDKTVLVLRAAVSCRAPASP